MSHFIRIGFLSALLPAVALAGVDVAEATNQLGLDLYRQLTASHHKGNLVLSPYSVQSCLALAYAGAAGETRTQMARVMHVAGADEPSVREGFGRLRAELAEVDRRASGKIEWNAANRLYAQSGYPFRQGYFALLRDGYAAPLEATDFRRDPGQAGQMINRWVESQTRNRIRNLIPAGALTEDTRLILVNAVYLKAPWETRFKRENTHEHPFHVSERESHRVPTMQRTEFLGYAHEDGFTIVSLEYVGRELQCLILLPDRGTSPDAVAAKLTPADFSRWKLLGRHARLENVALYLPKFELRGSSVALGEALRGLGMASAFDRPAGSANFDGIAPRRPGEYLALSDIFHQTFIALDEEKTEAAAASGGLVLGVLGVSEKKPIEVRVDRPFLIAIQHRPSGACLFLGRITDPR